MGTIVRLASLLFFGASPLFADPSVQVSSYFTDDSSELHFVFEQHDLHYMIAQNCHYNFFAAAKRSDLSTLPGKGLSIATFFRPEQPLEIETYDLKPIVSSATKRNSSRIYLRVLMPCDGGETFMSEITTVKAPKKRHGRSLSTKRFIHRMKYHMRWAD
ncbi:MAG: hypothetical protein KDD64_11690 [Bdellovibrionales bacterium]|nr:hypothetical protein [Bdellovibrionales bacterium]